MSLRHDLGRKIFRPDLSRLFWGCRGEIFFALIYHECLGRKIFRPYGSCLIDYVIGVIDVIAICRRDRVYPCPRTQKRRRMDEKTTW